MTNNNPNSKKLGFRKRVSKRLSKTKLKMFQAGEWATGKASVFFEAGAKAINAGAGSLSARNAAVDIAHAIEDYACSDYTLDTIATGCDAVSAIA